jgi:rhodanese-related sulfurtransferase
VSIRAFLPRVGFLRLVRRLRSIPAPQEFSWISTPELASRLADRAPPVVIDVRGADEFVGPLGHIAGAINIAIEDLAGRLPELERFRGRPLALVCKTDKRSANAAKLLRAAGLADVAVLRGGMEHWGHVGLPVEGARLESPVHPQ